MQIPLDLIDPPKILLRPVKTWRLDFLSLRDSIKANGILQNLIVRPKGDRYELVEGNHRLQCAKQLNFTEVPCKVCELSDVEALVYQIQANAMVIPTSKYEFAQHLKTILRMDPSLDLSRLASALNKPTHWVRKILSLNNLDEGVAEQIRDVALRSQLELAKLPREFQQECVEACQTLTHQELQSYVNQLLKSKKEALLQGRHQALYEEFQLQPSVRSLKQILSELEMPVAVRLLVTDETSGRDAWKLALEWVLHLDSLTRKNYMDRMDSLLRDKMKKMKQRKPNE